MEVFPIMSDRPTDLTKKTGHTGSWGSFTCNNVYTYIEENSREGCEVGDVDIGEQLRQIPLSKYN